MPKAKTTEEKRPQTPQFYNFDEMKIVLHQDSSSFVIGKHNNPNERLHAHDFIEIVTVNSGQGKHLLESYEHPIIAGDVFVIPRKVKHGYINENHLNITNMLFQMKTIDEHFPEIKNMPGFFSFFIADIMPAKIKKHTGCLLNLTSEELAYVEDLQAKIIYEGSHTLSGKASMSLTYIAQLLIYLSRLLEKKQNSSIGGTYSQLAKVNNYIDKHFKRKIPLSELASLTYMSLRNFQRIFTNIHGISPSKYILKVRLEKSRELLKKTSWEISKVAMESGFQETSYFSKQFKKCFGISPRQFRNIIKIRNR